MQFIEQCLEYTSFRLTHDFSHAPNIMWLGRQNLWVGHVLFVKHSPLSLNKTIPPSKIIYGDLMSRTAMKSVHKDM
jgi:hypothetical protein